jgi:hypothetical protein
VTPAPLSPTRGRREKMKIQLSRKKIADAILHNNETTVSGGDRAGVFVWPNGRAEVSIVGRGTTYIGPEVYDPAEFAETDLECDTTQWRNEAREEGIREGRIRDVFPDELTPEEKDLIDEYADLYASVWLEELRYLTEVRLECDDGSVDVIEVEWID